MILVLKFKFAKEEQTVKKSFGKKKFSKKNRMSPYLLIPSHRCITGKNVATVAKKIIECNEAIETKNCPRTSLALCFRT